MFLDCTADSVWIVLFLSSLLLHLISHELLHALALCAGVVVAVTFQQVDNAPDTETGTERDNEGLKNGDCLFKKCHIVC